ncbi:hypothetical protein [Streptomyces sp. NPDC088348]|uniref:hypothetical protein n=1 Tax=Streptomyces sp. NPDC088348 TaxID=3365853 RepID=UPI003826B3FF
MSIPIVALQVVRSMLPRAFCLWVGRAVGGAAIRTSNDAQMARALLQHPSLADFAERHGLGFADTTGELLHAMYTATGFAPQSKPVIAVVLKSTTTA